MNNQKITVEVSIERDIEKVWELWNEPEHIIKWNHASDDWHTVRAENELKVGGKFFYRMEAKDGSFGFDCEAIYTEVEAGKKLEYVGLGDRTVTIHFEIEGEKTQITESFDAENENPIELQKAGWQAILNNFKKYAESI
jgi:uncharacterized protein YndB with AHSA1/START domain